MDLKKIFFNILWHAEKWVLGILIMILLSIFFKSLPSLFQGESSFAKATVKIAHEEDVLKNLSIIEDVEFNQLLEIIEKPYNFKNAISRNLFSEVEMAKAVTTGPGLKKTNLDRDDDGMPDEWELRYGLDPLNSSDAQVDGDSDGWSNIDEYIHATDPTDANSFPGQVRLRVKKIFKKKVQIRFFGYVQLPGGNYELQVNWGQNTEFPRVNQKIRGYQIMDFTSNTLKRFNPLIGDYELVDESFIRIKRSGRDPIKLVLNKTSFEKELFAVIQDLETGEEFVVHGGGKIKSYEVLDIMPTRVIIIRNKKIYTLSLERRS